MITVRFNLASLGLPKGKVSMEFCKNVYEILLRVVGTNTDDLVPHDIGDMPMTCANEREVIVYILRRLRNVDLHKIVRVGYDGNLTLNVSIMYNELPHARLECK